MNGRLASWQRNTIVGGIELRFHEEPSEATRDALRELGWKWSPSLGCWFGRDVAENEQLANELCEPVAH
jgi:hypothetical protein